ncbi:hypothetical protein EV401DRAFT_2202737 [Pisolithus croceorrhizus]|nr:hypothetical protein EV401DRAFT_2202737 [Pisolithus croceorrhizus]
MKSTYEYDNVPKVNGWSECGYKNESEHDHERENIDIAEDRKGTEVESTMFHRKGGGGSNRERGQTTLFLQHQPTTTNRRCSDRGIGLNSGDADHGGGESADIGTGIRLTASSSGASKQPEWALTDYRRSPSLISGGPMLTREAEVDETLKNVNEMFLISLEGLRYGTGRRRSSEQVGVGRDGDDASPGTSLGGGGGSSGGSVSGEWSAVGIDEVIQWCDWAVGAGWGLEETEVGRHGSLTVSCFIGVDDLEDCQVDADMSHDSLQTSDITSNIRILMARTQPKKRRLFPFAKTSNSASDLASSPGRSESRAGDFSSIPETSGLTPPGRIARMRRFFHWSNQRPSPVTATEITDTQDSVGTQVALDQGAAETTTGGGAQEQQEQPQAAPSKNVCDLQ